MGSRPAQAGISHICSKELEDIFLQSRPEINTASSQRLVWEQLQRHVFLKFGVGLSENTVKGKTSWRLSKVDLTKVCQLILTRWPGGFNFQRVKDTLILAANSSQGCVNHNAISNMSKVLSSIAQQKMKQSFKIANLRIWEYRDQTVLFCIQRSDSNKHAYLVANAHKCCN